MDPGPGERDGWADALTALIAAGHDRDALMHYTLAEIRLYRDACERARRARLLDAACAARAAAGTATAWAGFIRRMN